MAISRRLCPVRDLCAVDPDQSWRQPGAWTYLPGARTQFARFQLTAYTYEHMRAVASELQARSTQAVEVTESRNVGEIDFEIVMTPESPRSASISWAMVGDAFIVSTSGTCEWQSPEHIAYSDDVDAFVRDGLMWSEALVRRIAEHGAAFIRMRGRLPRLIRETRAAVRDELPSGSFELIEAWEPW